MGTETKQKTERAQGEHPVHRTSRTAQGHEADVSRRDWDRPSFSPFALMRQGMDEIERWFGQLSSGRGSMTSPGGWMPGSGRGLMSQMARQMGDWTPAIDAFQRGNEFVVRAEVPGMNRQDITVEVADDALTIRGERKREFEEDREGVFWTERSYGSFTRVIPLPTGAIADSAKATFTNGMLEVVLQAPPAEARRGRRIDISGAP